MIAKLCEYIKTQWIVDFKRVNMISCWIISKWSYLKKNIIEIIAMSGEVGYNE